MKTLKNCWVSITAIVALLGLSIVGIVIDQKMWWHISSPDMVQLLSAVIGMAVIAALLLVKEKHLYKAALWLYTIVIAVLSLQMVVSSNYSAWALETSIGRNINIFGVSIYSSALLPLTYIFLSKLISEYKTLDHFRQIILFAAAICPMLLVLLLLNQTPAVISALGWCVVLAIMKKDGKIKLKRWLVLAAAMGIIAAIVYMYFEIPTLRSQFEVIFTRGKSDPEGAGWLRMLLDGIFVNTPMLGATNLVVEDFSINEIVSKLGDYNILLVLTNCGWLAFVGTILLYALFFFCLFKMVKATRQSTFARYTSLFLSLSLLLHAIVSLIGIFFMYSAQTNMPFIAHSYSINVLDYTAFGIVFTLYLRRNCESELIEKNETPKKTENSFLIEVKNFISGEDNKPN